MKAAVAADFELKNISGCPSTAARLYFANNKDKFEETQPYLWHGFSDYGSSLYWRIVFKPEAGPYFSPWLNHINRLDYLFVAS